MNSTASLEATPATAVPEWKALVLPFQTPSIPKAVWQLVNTFGSYILLWGLMYWTVSISWWLTVPLAILAGLLVIRAFIIFHDCGHGSFFKSRFANDLTGFISGVVTFTPYYHWRWEHALHHGASGDLDRRGTGDIWTMTVQEYLESTRWKRFAYRLARNPFILFIVAPVFLFLVRQRFPSSNAKPRERRSVWWMNCAIAAMVLGLGWIFGWMNYLIIQLIITMVSGAAGVWLFYVQHQFEDVYWERHGDWDYATAALQGSSFYKLPAVLRWFSGNIGFHHIHHLSPRIPNYNLRRCHESHPLFRDVRPLTVRRSLKSLAFRLWDERGRRLVGFRALRKANKTAPDSQVSKYRVGRRE
ncbi:MAG TPA: fatty acid desaturase [Verrucomicrobiales bacterium]|nr:fatty acid desaturase [Verrucomicrobiales bacterium]